MELRYAMSDLAHEFAQRGPWVTSFSINGSSYGGHFDAQRDIRLTQFFDHFPEPKTILELGSLEGGHSFALAQTPGVERVLALEGRETNIAKARFVQALLSIANVDFAQADLDSYDPSLHGPFDAVFCSGLLYHLARPWDLIGNIAKSSRHLFVWTHYVHPKNARDVLDGYRGRTTQEVGKGHPLSGISSVSFWPTLDSLLEMLTRNGFPNHKIIMNVEEHPAGPGVSLAAWSNSDRS